MRTETWISLIFHLQEREASTHSHGGLTVLNLDVVGGNKGSETGVGDVLVEEHGAQWGVGLGQVGGGGERGWLEVDEESVSVGSGTSGGSWAGVVGAKGKSVWAHLSTQVYSHGGARGQLDVPGVLRLSKGGTVNEPVSGGGDDGSVGTWDIGVDHHHGVGLGVGSAIIPIGVRTEAELTFPVAISGAFSPCWMLRVGALLTAVVGR